MEKTMKYTFVKIVNYHRAVYLEFIEIKFADTTHLVTTRHISMYHHPENDSQTNDTKDFDCVLVSAIPWWCSTAMSCPYTQPLLSSQHAAGQLAERLTQNTVSLWYCLCEHKTQSAVVLPLWTQNTVCL